MQCPKCQKEVSSEQECPYCGVIFRKFQERLSNERNNYSPGNQMRGSYASSMSSRTERDHTITDQETRKKGFLKFCIGTLGALAVGFFHYWLNTKGYEFTLWGFVTFGIPGAYGLAGLLELTTGIPFTQLASKWDSMKGWQQGGIGIIVVIICLGLLVGGLAVWGAMTM